MLISGFVGLPYEGISSFLHNRRHKALHKAVKAIENKVNLQCNKLIHIEDSMGMYSIYNAETLEKLIVTVHNMHNITTSNKRLFAGKLQEIVKVVKEAIWTPNPNYDIVVKRLHLYYDMKLVTFGLDRDRNLITQFSVFIQPYT